jgi:Ala-tRNA(Pro) deacylase
MAISRSAQEFLRGSCIAYSAFRHVPAFTAQEEAAATHIPGRAWAKVVACFADGRPIQAVVPADRSVDLDRLLLLTGASDLRLAREDELDWLYPDCERGAMPPFGPLYRQQVFVDAALATKGDVVFNAGTHADAVAMNYDEFVTLVHAVVGEFGERPRAAHHLSAAR